MDQTFAKYLFILLNFVGGIKAHGFIRIVILGAMGLAGLWMVHNLAQDYNKLQGGKPKLLDKRSIKVSFQQKKSQLRYVICLL